MLNLMVTLVVLSITTVLACIISAIPLTKDEWRELLDRWFDNRVLTHWEMHTEYRQYGLHKRMAWRAEYPGSIPLYCDVLWLGYRIRAHFHWIESRVHDRVFEAARRRGVYPPPLCK